MNEKVAPRSTAPSAQHRPPCRSTIRRTSGNPSPEPSYSPGSWNRAKSSKTLAATSGGNPTPLSETKKTGVGPSVEAPTLIRAGFRGLGILVNEQAFTKTANIWGVANNTDGTNSNRIVLFEKV